MRKELQQLYFEQEYSSKEKTFTFSAMLSKRGKTNGKPVNILLKNVTHNNIVIAEHLWVKNGSSAFKGLQKNNIYTFSCSIEKYTRKNHTIDYSIDNVKVISQ